MGSGAAGLLRTLGAVSGGVLRRKRPEAQRLRREQTLRNAADVLTKTGADFLPAVVAEIAASLGAELTFVGEILGDKRVQTVAVSRRGRPADNFAYPLRDSPTSDQTGAPFCYPDDVRTQFPNDPHLASVGARQ